MPSASAELVKQWGGEDGVGEDKAYEFLINRGWTELRGRTGMMVPPAEFVPWEEFDAICFLIDEWDYACMKPIKVEGMKVEE